MIDKIKIQVEKLLKNDNSGHGMEHINRVLNLSLKFAKEENANMEVVSLIALLHDVDDYKLFGNDNAKNLPNARLFMRNANIDKKIQHQVISELQNFGYSNRLKGLSPSTLEGKIVSDADMCDAIGVNGIIRIFTYSLKYNKPFFDSNIFPIDDINVADYKTKCSPSTINHIFEKSLKLKKFMLTNAGKREIEKRHKITVDVLYQLFEEENSPKWKEYLDNYLERHYEFKDSVENTAIKNQSTKDYDISHFLTKKKRIQNETAL